MKKLNHFYILLAALLLSVVACGQSAGGGENPTTAATEPPTSVPTEVQSEPFVSIPNIPSIKQLTDASGVGEKPLFKWESVTGAERYELVVFDEAGAPFWAWDGTVSQIYLGGTDKQPSADSNGPSIAGGYSWAVIAYGAEGKVIATSDKRPISP